MNSQLLFSQLTYSIRGSVFTVYNTLGFGHKEIVYHRALTLQFMKDQIPYTEETPIDVLYGQVKVGIYKPDFIVDKKIIIEIKATPFLSKQAEQ